MGFSCICNSSAILTILCLVQSVLSIPHISYQQETENLKRADTFEWSVIGDSWASGVAYNASNVWGPKDREACYRSKESWGAQMSNDNSWRSAELQNFNFAACGGTLMNDLKRQMTERAGLPTVVWGMFGGNDAFFGAIARACIYQPPSTDHPFGWGKPWDEDPDGMGVCKQNLKLADDYLNDPASFRKALTGALNDIFEIAQDEKHKKPHFDLYLSSYVRFFDDTTDACDKWSFAHDKISVGHPKLVKGLRKEINDMVQKANNIQADVIKNYQIPAPKLANYNVRNFQPDNLFAGHRFCEPNRTLEDQFYHKNLWLWNLQYNDEQKGEQAGVVMTDNGVSFMGSPAGVDVTKGFTTVLGIDNNPRSPIPDGSDPNTQQYGFGWTARPFHPKFDGNTALANSFIQKMRDDKIDGVKTVDTPPNPTPSSPSVHQKRKECYGLEKNKYISRDGAKDIIENKFCPEAIKAGPIERKYNDGTPEEVTIRLQGPGSFKPSIEDCKNYLLGILIDGCDVANHPENYKGGGKQTIDDVVYEIQPSSLRQPAEKGKQGGCDSTYKLVFNEYTIWGHG